MKLTVSVREDDISLTTYGPLSITFGQETYSVGVDNNNELYLSTVNSSRLSVIGSASNRLIIRSTE